MLSGNTINFFIDCEPETAVPAAMQPSQAPAARETAENIVASMADGAAPEADSLMSEGDNGREVGIAMAGSGAKSMSGNVINIYLDGTKNPNGVTPKFTNAMVHALETKFTKLSRAAAFKVTASGFTSDYEQSIRVLAGCVLALNDAGIEARFCSLEADSSNTSAEAVIAVSEKNAEAAAEILNSGESYKNNMLLDVFVPDFAVSVEAAEAPKRALSAADSKTAANLAYTLFCGTESSVFTDTAASVADGEVSFTTIIGVRLESQLSEAVRLLCAQASLAGFETSFG